MAIDTPAKRSSVFQLPGLMTNPFPEGSIGQGSRQQSSDVYRGILAAVPQFLPSTTCWNASSTNNSTWRPSGANSSTWRNSGSNSSTWVRGQDVTPCDGD